MGLPVLILGFQVVVSQHHLETLLLTNWHL